MNIKTDVLFKKYLCNKYKEYIDPNNSPCPHPHDYCQYREECIINALCMENEDCRKMRRNKIENTR
ncbi:MAG TPA: hypothetical protein DDW17_03320 [Deltaproteobacteria bacterium]|nr:hypothetical protein [Deltaproteobacteria bacterium]